MAGYVIEVKPQVGAYDVEGDQPRRWFVNYCGCGFDGGDYDTWRDAMDHVASCRPPVGEVYRLGRGWVAERSVVIPPGQSGISGVTA